MSSPIFISYSSIDQKVAETICDALQARGYSCWIACRNIGAGDNFQEAIVKAIRSARVMLLVFTSNANNSDEIKKEIVLAGRHRITVVPVRVEDVAPNDALAYEFATRQWIDLFKDWEREIERLTSQIGTILADGGPIRDIAGDPSAKPASVAPAAAANKSPLRPLVALAALLVAALGIGGAYFYSRPIASPASQAVNDESAWTDATSTGTVQAFREYLDRFPNGAHVADARQRIQASDDKAWADADSAGTIVALNRYLVQFPTALTLGKPKARHRGVAAKGRRYQAGCACRYASLRWSLGRNDFLHVRNGGPGLYGQVDVPGQGRSFPRPARDRRKAGLVHA